MEVCSEYTRLVTCVKTFRQSRPTHNPSSWIIPRRRVCVCPRDRQGRWTYRGQEGTCDRRLRSAHDRAQVPPKEPI